MSKMKLDDIDHQILDVDQNTGTPFTDIAKNF